MDRGSAWLQIVLGVGMVILGVGSLFDASATRVYLGAIIIGPILAIRGLYNLRQVAAAEERERAAERQKPAPAPRQAGAAPEVEPLHALALMEASKRVFEHCQACGKDYVYFPEASAAAAIQYKQLGHAAAP